MDNKKRTSMSVATITGFKCDNCGVETKTYDESVPLKCLNCGTDSPHQIYQDIIHTTTVVETVHKL